MWECQLDSAMESAHCLPKEAPASDGGVEEQYEVEEGMAYTQEIGISGKSLNSEGQTRKNLPRRNHRGVFCGKPRTPKRFRKSETRRDILPSHSLPITGGWGPFCAAVAGKGSTAETSRAAQENSQGGWAVRPASRQRFLTLTAPCFASSGFGKCPGPGLPRGQI